MKSVKSIVLSLLLIIIIIAVYLLISHLIHNMDEYAGKFIVSMIWLNVWPILPSAFFVRKHIKTWFASGKIKVCWNNSILCASCFVLLVLMQIIPSMQIRSVFSEFVSITALFFWYNLFGSFYKET